MSYQLVTDSIENWSKSYAGEKFHAVLCDPPYGLEFMGKDWDKLDKAVVSDPATMGGFQDGNGGNAFSRSRISRTTGFSKQPVSAMSERFRLWGEALLPHLYPGALVLMFGGTRTWHRLAVGMEEAGFEMWDTLMWLYGTGFPKAQDISKLIDKKNGDAREVVGTSSSGLHHKANVTNFADWNVDHDRQSPVTAPGSDVSASWSGHKTTALKPAWEPVLCFKKPLDGTYAQMAMQYGSGALNIDGARIEYVSDNDKASATPQGTCTSKNSGSIGAEPDAGREESRVGFERSELKGRYPANLILNCICDRTETVAVKQNGSVAGTEPSHTGDENTVAYGEYGRVPFTAYPGTAQSHTNPECPAAMLDAQAGQRPSTLTNANGKDYSSDAETDASMFGHRKQGPLYGDNGGPSRFFYSTKASTKERNAGLENLPDRAFGMSNQAKAEIKRGTEDFDNSNMGVNTVKKVKNHHPTVKPIALTEYLAKLLLPPESIGTRRLLVPFAGSGSEVIGALRAGWDEVVGIEREPDYTEIADARLLYQTGNAMHEVRN